MQSVGANMSWIESRMEFLELVVFSRQQHRNIELMFRDRFITTKQTTCITSIWGAATRHGR